MIRNLILFLLFVCLFQCARDKAALSPEEQLLNIFKTELSLVEKHQDNYIAYMQQQLSYFKNKNQLTSAAITAVNKQFQNMSDAKKEKYQRSQREKFQPVINNIYAITRKMIVKQTATLTPEKLVQIQDLSIKLAAIEKDTKMVKLVPLFFIVPESDEK